MNLFKSKHYLSMSLLLLVVVASAGCGKDGGGSPEAIENIVTKKPILDDNYIKKTRETEYPVERLAYTSGDKDTLFLLDETGRLAKIRPAAWRKFTQSLSRRPFRAQLTI